MSTTNRAETAALCTCGHPAAEHNEDGCMHPHDDGSFRFCPCTAHVTVGAAETAVPVKVVSSWLPRSAAATIETRALAGARVLMLRDSNSVEDAAGDHADLVSHFGGASGEEDDRPYAERIGFGLPVETICRRAS